MSESADIVIIGGGIVGLASAFQATRRFPGRRIVVVEKEAELAAHQSGRNSGVLHSGVYYKPGSLKAQNCREGKLAMEEFCRQYGVPYEICGKVIVAVDASESATLEQIQQRGLQNGVRCQMIGPERLAELEPHVRGVQALHVPEAGIVDFPAVCRKLAELLTEAGGQVVLQQQVTHLSQTSTQVIVRSSQREWIARCAVNCGGLHSDRLAKLAGSPLKARIVPFRGEYYEFRPEFEHLCRNLIYPAPNPALPFLGVHFTRMIQGGVECGPNAVLAFAREGYRKRDVRWGDLWEALTYGGFRRLSWKYWRVGVDELWRSFSKGAFVRALQRLIPEVQSKHLKRGRAGVRAQAVAPDGSMVDDFLIDTHQRIVNVVNAPSPAATSALNIGRLIADRVAQYDV